MTRIRPSRISHVRQLTLSVLLAATLPLGVLPPTTAVADDASVNGAFVDPLLVEPRIKGRRTAQKCVKNANGTFDCKPTAGGIALTRNGTLMYFNALEATENVRDGIGFEYGRVSVNDQSRVLDLRGGAPVWRTPSPVDGGASNKGGSYVLPKQLVNDPSYNDGAFFCPGMVQLADGSVLVVGGTDYYNEPELVGGYGFVELEGLKAARAFDPRRETWTQAGDMEFGRWYPGLITLGDNKLFITSGATKLMKPLYTDRPSDSGSNVRQTETFNPAATSTDAQGNKVRGRWTTNPRSADKSLPLYPRLHLLPNGRVFYNAGGQVFNPAGQSYDQALWNIASAYDPKTKKWTDLGVPGVGTTHPGFRGSTFSVMMPLRPDAKGAYRRAEFLSAGGILGVTPGTYLATRSSVINRVDTNGDAMKMSSRATGSLSNDRWYSSGVLLPDGSVLAVNGANRDEVVAPGTGSAVTQLELFDPKTETWRPAARQTRERTYHNSAILLPDGRVMLGGHAPIPTLYGKNQTLPGGFSANDGRDPSFEIYSPPYLFRGDRPDIADAPNRVAQGQRFAVATPDAAKITSVRLVRKSAATHIVDNDQRTVELPFTRRGNELIVKAPRSGAVLPAGPYMLFINARSDDGPIPSVSAPVMVTRR